MVRDFRHEGDYAPSRRGRSGFTLVEAMLVVTIVAILAALSVQGVRKYLVVARSAEAKQTISGIGRAVVVSVERLRERVDGPELCASAVTVPNAFWPVRARRYTPSSRPGVDYNTGSPTEGWRCLGFEVTHPQYYQYRYLLGGSPIPVVGKTWPADVPLDHRWAAYARGDLDGDDRFAWFALEGYVKDGNVVFASGVGAQDPDE
jgi:type IV pilus assembly protein PilA